MTKIQKTIRADEEIRASLESSVTPVIAANKRHMVELEVALKIVGNKGVRELLGRSIYRLRECNEALERHELNILVGAED